MGAGFAMVVASVLGMLLSTPSASATPTVRAHAVAPQIMSGETALYSVGSKAYGPHTWDSLTTHLVYQSDGNFVPYCNNGKVLWATRRLT
jgi:hypothetical protein